MSEIQTVINDFGTLSILMLAGYFLRKNIKLLQDLYLPAALVAGFIGLLLGPQILGQFSPVYIPISGSISKWAGVLTAVVFSVSFFGDKTEELWRNRSFGIHPCRDRPSDAGLCRFDLCSHLYEIL